LTRDLLAARRQFVVPLIAAMTGPGEALLADSVLRARWPAGDRTLMLLANLSGSARPKPDVTWQTSIWGAAPPAELPPWSVYAGIGGA
jgi:hypothetical protein